MQTGDKVTPGACSSKAINSSVQQKLLGQAGGKTKSILENLGAAPNSNTPETCCFKHTNSHCVKH